MSKCPRKGDNLSIRVCPPLTNKEISSTKIDRNVVLAWRVLSASSVSQSEIVSHVRSLG